MSKPNYRVTLSFDPDRKVFLARAPELEHCSGEGATRAEAILRVEEEIDAQLANMLSHGTQPPRSVDEETFSGEIAAKVSKTLHRDLAYQARSEGVELDHFLSELLASALEARRQTRAPRSGNRPQGNESENFGNRHDGNRGRGFGGRGANPALMEDRATFMEYVRGLDSGGGHQRGPHPGGGGGGGPGRDGRRRRGGRGGAGGGGGGGGNGNYNRQGGHGGPGNYNGGRPQMHAQPGPGMPPRAHDAPPAAAPMSAPAPAPEGAHGNSHGSSHGGSHDDDSGNA